MRSVAEAAVALLDLLEVEVRTLRRGAVRTAMAIGLVAVGTSLLGVAAGLILAAFYLVLAPALSAAGAALLTALVTAALAGVAALVARGMVQ